MTHNAMLTPAQVCARLGVTNSTLQTWRKTRRPMGPPWVRLGHRTVRYPSGDLEEWLEERR